MPPPPSPPPQHTHPVPPIPRNASHTPGRSGSACPSTQRARGRWVPMEPRWHYQFRVIMLGDSTVGKSSLLRRYTEGVFLDAVNQTVGVDFYVQFVELEPGLHVKLQFWDTAGQERFRSVTRSYYRNSAGGMLLFDLTNRASFDNVQRWHREVTDTVQPFHVVFLLVGHKSDLAAERKVGRREAERLAASLGAQYVETSAKDGSDVARAFQMLTLAIYRALQSGLLAPCEAWDGVKSSVPLPAPCPKKEEKRKREPAEQPPSSPHPAAPAASLMCTSWGRTGTTGMWPFLMSQVCQVHLNLSVPVRAGGKGRVCTALLSPPGCKGCVTKQNSSTRGGNKAHPSSRGKAAIPPMCSCRAPPSLALALCLKSNHLIHLKLRGKKNQLPSCSHS
ncbi:putative Ras-related protein Rab-42 isoform X1 [Numida meleagris]|uniref:putative Ras-related protein Rab-42 isoform X1 n=1 Tax=Numida meleagris TaxID=8996 RepID=UPI000B3E1193|nr:putative Ras-related protein Rab-42 isoform X1 [Numida meleagris]